MDAIAKVQSAIFGDIWTPTNDAFYPLLESRRAEIESVRRETYQYGKTERHKLDVYYPSSKPTDGSKFPVIFFSYLGGLEFGDRILPESDGLVYRNFGAFFTKQGFLTAVADYRLVPEHGGSAVYPDCLQDVFEALCFLTTDERADISADSASEEETRKTFEFRDVGDMDKIFILAHSAGALNQSSLMLHPTIMPPSHPLRKKIKGAIWNGGAYSFDHPYSMPIEEYYGPPESKGHIHHSSIGLLRSAPEEILRSLPPLLIISAERESDSLFRMVHDFAKVLREKGVPFEEYLNKGHNHVSSYLSLMSGEGDDWGYEVVNWIRTRL